MMTPSLVQLLADALDLEFADRPRIATLATADESGTPRARSVIVRRLTQHGEFWITSDARSEKNRHLRANRRAELVFYLSGRREQLRVAGDCTPSGEAEPRREEAWKALSDESRALFFGPADPNFGADPNVVHSAYSNNFFGATATQLYGIDTGLDILVTQANSAGTLGTVGPTGVDIDVVGGFDISGTSGIAFAAAQSASSSQSAFYSVNLATGAFTNLGSIGGGETIIAMSVFAVPGPAVLAGLAMGLIGMRRRRRTA